MECKKQVQVNVKPKLINIPNPIFEKVEKYQKENCIPHFTTAFMEIVRIGLREIEKVENNNR